MKALPLILLALLAPSAFAQDQRKWKDTQGRTIDATYLALEGDSVKVKLSNGKTSLIPLAKLSEADRQWVKDRQAPPKPVTPVTPPPGGSSKKAATLEEVAKTTKWAPLTDLGDKLPPGLVLPPPSDENAIIAIWPEKIFIKADGSIAFPQHKFTTFLPFSEDLAWVGVEGKPGYINREGNFVIGGDSKVPLPDGSIDYGSFANGRALFRTKEGVGYIDKSGAVVIPVGNYKRGQPFSDGLAAVSSDNPVESYGYPGVGNWQYINPSGEVVIPGPFTWPRPFSSGIAWVGIDFTVTNGTGPNALIGKSGERFPVAPALGGPGILCGSYVISGGNVVDMKNSPVMPAKTADYSLLMIESATPVAFGRYQKWTGGRLVHLPSKSVYGPPIEGQVYFVEGFSGVPLGSGKNKWGCIDLSGRLVIPPGFSESPEFKDGYALTKRFVGEQEDAEQLVVINRKGKIIWQGEAKKKS